MPDKPAGVPRNYETHAGLARHALRNSGRDPPLLYATRTGNLEMVDLLLAAGADIEAADANGVTPLLNAILNASVASRGVATQHFEIANRLIEVGADVNAQDWYGETPLWAAVDVRNLDVTSPEKDNGIDRDAALQLIERLLDHDAEIIEYLALNGADLERPDNEGRTPKIWAEGVFLATHPPVRKPEPLALLDRLVAEQAARN